MKHSTRFLAVLLALALLTALLPVAGAAYDGDRMDQAELRELLNSVELHPQKTNYPVVDALLENLTAQFTGDNYDRLKAAYDWATMNITYSWWPYTQDFAPAYDCFWPQMDMPYGMEGLQETMPRELVNRAYFAMTEQLGVCYDYAAVFTVLARYMGFECFLHTGIFIFESMPGQGHHGWAALLVDGHYYIFDPQRDYRLCGNATRPDNYYYFGIDEAHAWRYNDEEASAARDAQFMPVTQTPVLEYVAVHTVNSGSGWWISGEGRYDVGQTVTVSTGSSAVFLGWYDENGALLTKEHSFSFEATVPTTLYAVYYGQFYRDVPKGSWFSYDVNEAFSRGIATATAPFTFAPDDLLSRAMALTFLARAVQTEPAAKAAPFEDLQANAWYEDSVNWAYAEGIVNGVSETVFAPDAAVTRQEFLTMLMRYLRAEGYELKEGALSYADAGLIDAYALQSLAEADALGLLRGYEDGTVRPQSTLTRAEGVTLVMRLVYLLETNALVKK